MGLSNSAGLTSGLAKDALTSNVSKPPEEGVQPAGTTLEQKEQSATSDAAILARAQAGDHTAFAHLYSAHKRRVYSLCLRMLGNVAEAEDLTQESF